MVVTVVTQEVLQDYLAQARRYYGVEVAEKTTSRFMRLLATLMFFNKTFLSQLPLPKGKGLKERDANSDQQDQAID